MNNLCRKITVRVCERIKYHCGVRSIISDYLLCKRYNLKKIPVDAFKIKGLVSQRGSVGRLPNELLNGLNKKNSMLEKNARCLSGCYIEFCSTTKQCFIEVTEGNYLEMDHMTPFGINGVDVYEVVGESNYIWKGCYVPDYSGKVKIDIRRSEHDGAMRLRIYFPMFVPTSGINIFIDPDASFIDLSENGLPICFYGSSITQGCSASRPGLSYPALIGRSLNCPIFNLGFSESAHGEWQIADWISKQCLRCIVIEYDHNATVDELRDTHYLFYEAIRKNNRKALIILLSRGSVGMSIAYSEYKERKSIIEDTINKAQQKGDQRITYIDLYKAFTENTVSDYFVDGKHPNDKGMQVIAENIMEKIIEYEA